MKKSSTEGIILQSRETGEGDVISRIYTEEYGLITGIFKGLKKSRRRSAVSAELGVLSLFTIPRLHNDRVSVIQESAAIDIHEGIRKSLRKIVHLNLLSELVLKTAPPHSNDRYFFRMLRAALDTLETSGYEYHLAAFFTIHLLRIQGILPSFENCSSCGRDDKTEYHFSLSDRALLCPVCARIPRGSYLRVGYNERMFALQTISRKFSNCDLTLITEEEASSLLFPLLLYIEHYFHIEFKTKTFLFSDELLNVEKDIM